MASTSKLFDMDLKADSAESRRSSIDSSIIDVPATISPPVTRATTSRTASSSNISKTTTSSTSSTRSKRQKVKSWLKRVGSGMLESLAYSNAIEYSPAAVQYYERKAGERTPDEVLNDIYAYRLWTIG